ncbi:hypothetical protein [Megamonas sp.]|nr:hypothetical protein [Megamonas sp.]
MINKDIEYLKKRRRMELICKISLLLTAIVGTIMAVKIYEFS